MKIELLLRGKNYYIYNSYTEDKVPIVRDPNESDLEYTNKAYIILDKQVNYYQNFIHGEYQTIKTVNI